MVSLCAIVSMLSMTIFGDLLRDLNGNFHVHFFMLSMTILVTCYGISMAMFMHSMSMCITCCGDSVRNGQVLVDVDCNNERPS